MVNIAYYVTNNVQHGHQMIVKSLVQSQQFLPGAKWQPAVRSQWSVENAEVQAKYFAGNNIRNVYEFDPIYMGDFKNYKFKLEMNDITDNNYFLTVNQAIRPRKCVRIIDLQSKTPEVTKQFEIVKAATYEDLQPIVFEFQVERIEGCTDEKIPISKRTLNIET